MRALELIDTWPVPVAAAAVIDASTCWSWGPADRVLRLASVSKLITAWATLIAIEDGSVDLDGLVDPPNDAGAPRSRPSAPTPAASTRSRRPLGNCTRMASPWPTSKVVIRRSPVGAEVDFVGVVAALTQRRVQVRIVPDQGDGVPGLGDAIGDFAILLVALPRRLVWRRLIRRVRFVARSVVRVHKCLISQSLSRPRLEPLYTGLNRSPPVVT